MDVLVPAGVRVCDAAEFFNSEEVFVYADGFGKGSPSAFANLFRYRLLASKGCWWVDTDVICLAEDIPPFSEFFAQQDADFINGAVLCFEPNHPLMVRCLADATELGRMVRWGDTGPFLLTKVAEELGYRNRALASCICYPLHYSEAADVLRPSRSESIRHRTETSLFIHLWNGMLQHLGVQKTFLAAAACDTGLGNTSDRAQAECTRTRRVRMGQAGGAVSCRAFPTSGSVYDSSAHSLRHTHALPAGVDVYYVSRVLGARIQETVDTYGRWVPANRPGVLDVLDDAAAAERAAR